MDPILQVLLSWQLILFGLSIAAILYVFRLFVEYFADLTKINLTKSKLWNDLLLPILPIAVGIITGYYFKFFPYPVFPNSVNGYPVTGDRIMFGSVAGLLSASMYRVIKSLLYQKIVSVAQSLQVPGTPVVATPVVVVPEEITDSEISSRGKI